MLIFYSVDQGCRFPGHTGRIVLGHTQNILTLMISDELKKNLKNVLQCFKKVTNLCGPHLKPSWAGCGLDKLGVDIRVTNDISLQEI